MVSYLRVNMGTFKLELCQAVGVQYRSCTTASDPLPHTPPPGMSCGKNRLIPTPTDEPVRAWSPLARPPDTKTTTSRLLLPTKPSGASASYTRDAGCRGVVNGTSLNQPPIVHILGSRATLVIRHGHVDVRAEQVFFHHIFLKISTATQPTPASILTERNLKRSSLVSRSACDLPN